MADPTTDPLVARGITAGYGGLPVVDRVDLTVVPREIVGLVGANGRESPH